MQSVRTGLFFLTSCLALILTYIHVYLGNVGVQANILANLAYCHDEKKNYQNALRVSVERVCVPF